METIEELREKAERVELERKIKGETTSESNQGIIAFILLLCLGYFGIHWFYLKRPSIGLTYLLCGTIGWLLFLPGFIPIIGCIIDFFRLLFSGLPHGNGYNVSLWGNKK